MSQCNIKAAQALVIAGLDNVCGEMCVPETSGMPTTIPGECDPILNYDPATGSVWLFVCGVPDRWVEIGEYSNCNLETIDTALIGDICNALQIAVTADGVDGCVDAKITLATLVTHIQECICAGMQDDPAEADSAISCGVNGNFVSRPITPFCETVVAGTSEAIAAISCDPITGQPVESPITPFCATVVAGEGEATSAISCDPITGQPVERPITPLCDTITNEIEDAEGALDCVNGALVRRPLPSIPGETVLLNCNDVVIDHVLDRIRTHANLAVANERFVFDLSDAEIINPTIINNGQVEVIYHTNDLQLVNPLSCPALVRIEGYLERSLFNPSLAAAGEQVRVSGFFQLFDGGFEVTHRDYFNDFYTFTDLEEGGGLVILDGSGFSATYAGTMPYTPGTGPSMAMQLDAAISVGSDGSVTYVANSKYGYEVTWIAV